MPELNKEEQKAMIKEALQEWMEKKYADVGRWSMRGIFIMAIGTLVYIWLGSHGWKP